MTAYDRAVDRHLDHTEENPDQTCFFCKRNDWVEEQDQRQEERNAYTRGMLKRMRTDYSIIQKKIKHLELSPSREAELKETFNDLDDKLSEHDDEYQDYKREQGQYSEESITELRREEYELKQAERQDEERNQKIGELKEKLVELQEEMNNNGHNSIRREKIEYNKTLKKLNRLDADTEDFNRKIVNGDEASGYGKKVY